MSQQGRGGRLSPDQRARVTAALPVVEGIARTLARRWPAVPRDDLRQMVAEAVARAALTHDPSRGGFEPYAWAKGSFGAHDAAEREVAQAPLWLAIRAGLEVAAGVEDTADPFTDEDETPTLLAAAYGDVLFAMASTFALASARAARSPEEQVAEREEARRLRALFGALPDEDRRVLELHDLDGLAWSEVAAALGVTEDAAKNRAKRVRAKLRAALEDPAPAPDAP